MSEEDHLVAMAASLGVDWKPPTIKRRRSAFETAQVKAHCLEKKTNRAKKKSERKRKKKNRKR